MGRKTFSILFMVRRGQLLKNQEAPIYMRITVDGERAEISTKRSVDHAHWNEIKGCGKSGIFYAKELNYYLEQLRHKVYEHQQDLINRNKVISAESLKNAFLNVGDDDRRTLLKTNDEHNKNLELPRIAQVRDIFVFCCFTGLAFVDVKSLGLKDLETGFDGNLWIKKQRHKSKQWVHIPLLPVAKQIIDKYHTNPDCIRKGVLLPVLTNQKMNAYLKEVADLFGINKNLTKVRANQ